MKGFVARAPASRDALLRGGCACGGAAKCAACGAKTTLRGAGAEPEGALSGAGGFFAAQGPEYSFARISIYPPAAPHARGAGPATLGEEHLEDQPQSDAGRGGAAPLDTAPPVDTRPSSPLIQPGVKTGATGCETASGTAKASTSNTDPCTVDCSRQHEEKHAADIGPCCAKAGAASKKADKQEDKDAIQAKFDTWMLANENLLECRGYGVSITCGEKKHKDLKCPESPYNDSCCAPLTRYIRSARIQKEGPCNNAAEKMTECPFA